MGGQNNTWYPQIQQKGTTAPGDFSSFSQAGGSESIVAVPGWALAADFDFTALPNQTLVNGANTVVDSPGNSFTVTVAGLGAGNTLVITNGTGLVFTGGAGGGTSITFDILCSSLFSGYFVSMNVGGLMDLGSCDLQGNLSRIMMQYFQDTGNRMTSFTFYDLVDIRVENATVLAGGPNFQNVVFGPTSSTNVPGRIGGWWNSGKAATRYDATATAADDQSPESPSTILRTKGNANSPAAAWDAATDVMRCELFTANVNAFATVKRLRWFQR